LSVVSLAVLLAACNGDGDDAAAASAPAPQVGVVVVRAQPLALATELPGRTAAYRVAEVRPQVNGIVQRRLFTEGSLVEKGQQLYQIDPATYRAALARAEATELNARHQAERYRRLMKQSAVSRQQHDDAEAAWKLAKAELELARINLDYTQVKAPINGRIGRSAVTEGALVTGGQAQALATIQQLDPIYVDLTRPMGDLLQLRQDFADGRLQRTGDGQARVSLLLGNGQRYPREGALQFSEVTVDEGTGSVTLRAVFPNPEGVLLPGMFVQADLSEGVREHAILVPQQAVQRDPKGNASAWVIGPDGSAERRELVTERTVGNQWLVSEGLAPGDQLVVEGGTRLRQGQQVQSRAVELRRPVLDFRADPGAAAARVADR
jgi:membrane fusion protein (multidrug efflux system)